MKRKRREGDGTVRTYGWCGIVRFKINIVNLTVSNSGPTI